MRRPGNRKTFFAWTATVLSALLALTLGSTYGLMRASGTDDVVTEGSGVVSSDADGYTLTGRSDLVIGDTTELLVGSGPEGVSVAYLRFTIAGPVESMDAAMTVTVTRANIDDLVEVVQVSPEWTEDVLSADSAPRFGPVLDSRQVSEPDTVTFDVSGADLSAASVAFAITTPSTDGQFRLAARESGQAASLRAAAVANPTVSTGDTSSAAPVVPGPSASSPIDPTVSDLAPTTPVGSPSSIDPSTTVDPSLTPIGSDAATASGPVPTPLPLPGVSDEVESVPNLPSPGLPSPVTPVAPIGPGQPPLPSRPDDPTGPPQEPAPECVVGDKLVPTCGALQGIAPAGKVPVSKTEALIDFEEKVQRRQHIYHSYHRGVSGLFPTRDEIAVARDPDGERLLFINWKPRQASWAEIAAGDPETDAYLDELGAYIKKNFDEPFFFTVHHEPENDVIQGDDSGYRAEDYAAMFRYVVERLRAAGADKMVSVIVFMAYLKWMTKAWHSSLYPGDDVVDWVAWDSYGYSDPGYGHGDFAELVNRVSGSKPDWPGTYRWAATTFPDKPLMIGEWGVWHSKKNPGHQAKVFADAAPQLNLFPRLKAVLYFESPVAEGRSSQVDDTAEGLVAFQQYCAARAFDVAIG